MHWHETVDQTHPVCVCVCVCGPTCEGMLFQRTSVYLTLCYKPIYHESAGDSPQTHQPPTNGGSTCQSSLRVSAGGAMVHLYSKIDGVCKSYKWMCASNLKMNKLTGVQVFDTTVLAFKVTKQVSFEWKVEIDSIHILYSTNIQLIIQNMQ